MEVAEALHSLRQWNVDCTISAALQSKVESSVIGMAADIRRLVDLDHAQHPKPLLFERDEEQFLLDRPFSAYFYITMKQIVQ